MRAQQEIRITALFILAAALILSVAAIGLNDNETVSSRSVRTPLMATMTNTIGQDSIIVTTGYGSGIASDGTYDAMFTVDQPIALKESVDAKMVLPYMYLIVPETINVNCNLTNTGTLGGSCINSNVTNSTIIDSNITNSTIINCTIINSTIINSTKINMVIINTIQINSNASNSTETNSTITNSTVTNSTLNSSTVNNSVVKYSIKIGMIIINSQNIWTNGTASTEINSTVEESVVDNSTIINSNVYYSTVINSTKSNVSMNYSTNLNSAVENTIEQNSTIEDTNSTNSTIIGSEIDPSVIINSIIQYSTIKNCTIIDSTVLYSTDIRANLTNVAEDHCMMNDTYATNAACTNSNITNSNLSCTERLYIENAVINNNLVQEGEVVYFGFKRYYGPKYGVTATISQICAEAPKITAIAPGDLLSKTVTLRIFTQLNHTPEIYIDGKKYILAFEGGYNWTYAWDTTLETDGSHIITAKDYDPFGKPTESTPVLVTVDNTAPIITILQPNVAVTSLTTLTLQGFITDATSKMISQANYTVENASGSIIGQGTLTLNAAGQYSTTISLAQNQMNTIRINAVDDARVNNSATESYNIRHDNTMPIAIITSPTDGALTAVNTINVQTTVSGAEVAYLFVNGKIAVTINNSGTGTYPVILTDGNNKLHIEAISVTGVKSLSDTVNVRYVKNVSGIGFVTADKTIAKNGDIIKFTFNGGKTGLTVTLNTSLLSDTVQSIILNDTLNNGMYEESVTVQSTQIDGPKTTELLSIDGATTYTTSTIVILDNTPPAAAIKINNGANQTSSVIVNAYMSYSDANGVERCRLSNEPFNNSQFWEACSEQKTWQLIDDTITGVAPRTVYFQVEDKAGLVSEANATILLNKTGAILDYTPPINLTITNYYNWTNKDLFAASWKALDKESKVFYAYRIIENTGDDPSNSDTQVYPLTVSSPTPEEEKHLGREIPGLSGSTWKDAGDFGDETSAIIDMRNISGTMDEGHSYYFEVIAINGYGFMSAPGFSNATITDYSTPFPPQVDSSTHPGEGAAFVKDSNAIITWGVGTDDDTKGAPSGIKGYSYVLTTGNESPDNIPEGDPNNLTALHSASFNDLADGTYYFMISSIDNAGNLGDPANYTIKVDTTPPGPPQLKDMSMFTNQPELELSWIEAKDGLGSGIARYDIQYCTDPVFSSCKNATSTTNGTMLTGLENGTWYYIRIYAMDKVGLMSQPSSVLKGLMDQKPPEITWIKPIGQVADNQPIMAFKTDERAECIIMMVGSQDLNMTLTGGVYHERKGGYMPDGDYTLTAYCEDLPVRNSNTKEVLFTTNGSLTASDMTVYTKPKYYLGQEIVFNATITDISGKGIGGLPKSRFTIGLGNDTITDFGIDDIGSGDYIIILPPVLRTGEYPINVSVDDTGRSTTVIIEELTLDIKYTGFTSTLQSNDKIIYQETPGQNYTVGLGSDATSTVMQINGQDSTMEAGTSDGNAYIFVTNTGANLDQRSKYLRDRTFQGFVNPSFGYPIQKDLYTITTELGYQDIILKGDTQRLQSGRYTLIVRNAGIDPATGKTIVEVEVR